MGDKIKPLPKSARTVTVGSKLQHDILLTVDTPRDAVEVGQHGQTTRKVYVKGDPVCIYGVQRPRGEIPEGYPQPEKRNGYAITRNIPAEWWEAWVAQHENMEIYKNNLIFAETEDASVTAHSKDFKDLRCGLEPINPKDDPRMPRSMDTNVGRVETDEARTSQQSH